MREAPPLLAAKDVRERSLVAGSFALVEARASATRRSSGGSRSKTDIAVRGAYLPDHRVDGGEASPDVFRANLGPGTEFDSGGRHQASIADIGSKKGLQHVAPGFASPDP